ncbi:bifunctional aspartate kinase/homoserine dehydrogenase I [Pontibacter sp. SGAir0037]|uniref:bifunctional aspartate kinase/homoserine dehydrogenase I n=1 Tax=Pontibacter sp. SGAir0037 TaxID=2571030 RepID=UPI0010CCBA4B|nr:bifunctional aspartate kinase/homoserine dehydrogenase I [Pontibacter sp. SGAir0037]QCR23191.1 bifunctional aspartate kinase/homoserine dehydrogenase I [Pontibacter sp. SGAir0037]
MKVLKFGGTAVGSLEGINNMLDIINAEIQQGETPVIIISAMGGVTNMLAAMAEQAAQGGEFEAELNEIKARHIDVVKEMLPMEQQNEVFGQLQQYFDELTKVLQAIQSLKECTAKTHDLVISYGERCAAYLISKIAEQQFPESVFVDSTHLIKTDSNFGQARVDTKLTDNLISAFYHSQLGSLLFITGFIASDHHDQVTTLGRGGSDYTAAIVGSALNCSEIQIWTGVNGMMTADPKLVKKAFSLPELTYTEAMEMTFFGAKVVYPPTMMPVFLKKIPIIIKNIHDPAFAGTKICSDCQHTDLPIRGISSIHNISVVNLQGSGMIGKAGFSGRLFSMLAREQINVILITQSSSEHSITFAIDPKDDTKAQQLIEQEFELELQAKKLELPEVESGLSILAIVGENMKKAPGISGKLFHALGRNGINIRAIAQGSSEYNISVVIAQQDLAKANNAVHDAFFTELKKTLHVFCVGTGNIGKTLFRQLNENADFLQKHNGIQVNVVGISNSRKMLLTGAGIALEDWQQRLEEEGEPADLGQFIGRMKEMNLPNCVFADNTASPLPVTYYEEILSAAISVVTSNKIGNSSSYSQYNAFKEAARSHGVDFYYETNVGAGLPIVRTLKDLMLSGDRVLSIEAVLSGTISFIFNYFKGDASFHDVVKLAQEKGYTEPDPRDDLNGTDFMRKMLILARDAGHELEAQDVQIENILPASCLNAQSVPEFYQELKAADDYFNNLKQQAESSGRALRYIGKLEGGKVSITLQMVDESHPFFVLSGSDNIISFTTERYKERPLVVKGPGAGAEVTAAGVFADLINVGTL